MNPFKALALAESALLILLSFLPASTVPVSGAGATRGELEHFLAYTLYGFLAGGALTLRKNALLWALVAGAGMGLLTEAIQLFVPTRFFDLNDLALDILGAAEGGILSTLLIRGLRPRPGQ